MKTEENKQFQHAVIYLRTARDPRSTTPEQQRSACLERCLRVGFDATDVTVIEDAVDTAQWSGVRRGLERLVTLDALPPTLLVVWRFDHLFRAPEDLTRLIDAAANRPLRVEAVHGTQVDLETAPGRLRARLLAVLSTYEDAISGRDRVRSDRGDRHAL